MPSIGSRLPRLFALVLGFSSSNGLLLKFVTPVSRVSPSYAANNDAKHSEYRGLITFDLDNTVFPMQPVLLDAAAAVEAHAGTVLKPEAVAIAMKALRTASDRVSETSTPSTAPWSYTRTRIAAYEALLASVTEKDEASSSNSGAVMGSDAWADSWVERDAGNDTSQNKDDVDDVGNRSPPPQGFSKAAAIDAEVAASALASFEVWLNERQAAAGRQLWADVAPCLAALEQQGWLLGAITNGRGDPTAIPGLERLEFCVSGEDVNIYPLRKPHRAIFEAAMTTANSFGWQGTLSDSSISSESGTDSGGQMNEALWWHVGDCLNDDISGASKCGAKTVLIARRDSVTGESLLPPSSRKANPLASPSERGDHNDDPSSDALEKTRNQPDLVVESLEDLHAQIVSWKEGARGRGEIAAGAAAAAATEASGGGGRVGDRARGGSGEVVDESLVDLLAVPLKELRVSRLRSALKHRQLPSTGNKATLVARLQAAAAASADAAAAVDVDGAVLDTDTVFPGAADTNVASASTVDGNTAATGSAAGSENEESYEARPSMRPPKDEPQVLKDTDVAEAIAGGGLYSTPRDGVMKADLKAGDWVCKQCSFHNFASRAVCFSCKKPQGTAGLSLPEGVKLKDALSTLVDEMGWAELAEQTGIRCFVPNKFGPTMASALRFLRSPSETWARARVESLYIELGLFVVDEIE